jgi:hypothetical protein
MKSHRGVEYTFTLSLTLALAGMAGQHHVTAALSPGIRPGTPFTGGWVDRRMGVDRCEKPRPPPKFDPRTAQPVASRYTSSDFITLFLNI